jgi:hypothetical protein
MRTDSPLLWPTRSGVAVPVLAACEHFPELVGSFPSGAHTVRFRRQTSSVGIVSDTSPHLASRIARSFGLTWLPNNARNFG